MREYVSKIDHKKLRGDGANLSAVLRNLCNGGQEEVMFGSCSAEARSDEPETSSS